MVVFRQSGYIWETVVVFGQKCLYSGKRGCIMARLLYSGKVAKLYSGKSGCIRTNWLNSCKVVVCGQGGCIWANFLNSGENGCIRAKVVVFG